MARIVVLLSVCGDNGFNLVGAFYMMGKSEELTPFLGVKSFAFAVNGCVRVGHESR